MGNYYTNKWNQFIDNSESIFNYISGSYMYDFNGQYLSINDSIDIIRDMRFTEILGYRRLQNEKITAQRLLQTMKQALEELHSSNCAVAFFIVNDNSNLHIFYATQPFGDIRIENRISEAIPDLITENRFMNIQDIKKKAIYGGVVTGVPGDMSFDIDQVLNGVKHYESVVAFVARPVSDKDRESYFDALNDLKDSCEQANTIEYRFGRDSNRTITRKIPSITNLLDYAEKEINRYGKREKLWEYCIWFGTEDVGCEKALGNILAGAINSTGAGSKQSGKYFLLDRNPLNKGCFGIPRSRFDSMHTTDIDGRLIKSSLSSYVFTDELSNMIKLPTHEHVGFTLINMSPNANDSKVFSINPPKATGDVIEIGKVSGSEVPYRLELRQLTKHMLVIGATGTGKTNTVKQILLNASKRSIPYCVIEPEKKHYWRLIGNDKHMRVYSTSRDAEPIYINILEPEVGMSIGNHMGDLFDILAGLFEMEEATRGGFLGLLKYTYHKYGWKEQDIVTKTNSQARRFPTLRDLLRDLPNYCSENLVYGDEVRSNIEGSVKLRLEELCTGDVAEVLASGKNISGKTFCSGPVIIELDSLSARSKAVVSGFILDKIYRYKKQCDHSDNLKHLIVLEEAHNVFRKRTDYPSPYNITSGYFCRLLDTIRAYGTGVIIANQRVDDLDKSAVANTETLIAHRIGHGEDASCLEYPMELNSVRKQYLRGLKPGECIVAIGGYPEICKVLINRIPFIQIKNIACMMCRHRGLCNYDEISVKLKRVDKVIADRAKAIVRQSDNPTAMVRLIDSVMKEAEISPVDKYCALGHILKSEYCIASLNTKRRIIYDYISAGGKIGD